MHMLSQVACSFLPSRFYCVFWLCRVLKQKTSNVCWLVSNSLRFKDHVQNNLPRELLTTEQFIQLRRELASANGHSGEDVSPGDDLPSGTEDITDPAKVHLQREFVGFLALICG